MTEPTAIDGIASRYWEDTLHLSPLTATLYGDSRFDDRLDDPGPEGRAARVALARRAADEALAVPVGGLGVEDRITRDMLRIAAELGEREADLGFHELTQVDHMQGPQTLLAQVAQFQPADTPERLERFLAVGDPVCVAGEDVPDLALVEQAPVGIVRVDDDETLLVEVEVALDQRQGSLADRSEPDHHNRAFDARVLRPMRHGAVSPYEE